MFSQNITQILFFGNNLYIYRCGFSIRIQRFYSYTEQAKTDYDILQLLKIVENCHIWKRDVTVTDDNNSRKFEVK